MKKHSASLNPPRESWGRLIGTLLLVLLVVGIALVAAITLSILLEWVQHSASFVAAILLGTMVGELLALGLLAWRLHRRGRTLRDLGWGQSTRWWSVALGIGIALLYSGFTIFTNPVIAHHLLEVSLFKLVGVGAAVVAGVVEESIFRGYVMTTLNTMGYRAIVQILMSGVFFALFHLYVFTDPLSVLLVQGATFVLGSALAVTYLLGKRSLTPVILSHTLVDLLLEPWLFLSFFGGR